MDPYLVLLLVLLTFALLLGALTVLRREPLAWRHAVEILLWGAVLMGICWVLQAPSPILYFVALYLVTMRSRLLVDVANLLARSRHHVVARRLYELAQRVATNPVDRHVVLANQGAALLLVGSTDEAVVLLEKVLSAPAVGIKLEAASRCNLGLAYLRQGRVGQGRAQLHEVSDLLPTSVYSLRAQRELRRLDASSHGLGQGASDL